MSYDYNQIVCTIQNSRSINPQTPSIIEQTLNHFNNLSTKCPMTPLLWMQYAYDAGYLLQLLSEEDCNGGEQTSSSSVEVTSQILESGLVEFPSCAMLRLYHLDCIIVKALNNGDENVKDVWDDIVSSICLGCHGGCDEAITVALFNLYINYLLQLNVVKNTSHEVSQLFIKRAELFMKEGNDTLRSEMSYITENHGIIFTDSDYDVLEKNRQLASQHWNFLGNLEDDVLIAMEQDGVATPPALGNFALNTSEEAKERDNGTNIHKLFYDWGRMLKEMEKKSTYLMGYGMMHTSNSFIKYSKTIVQQMKHLQKAIKVCSKNDDCMSAREDSVRHQLQIMESMMIQIFERGVAECPTVELIWQKYIKHLLFMLHESAPNNDERKSPSHIQLNQTVIMNQLKMVSDRAVRNCPYSVNLYCLKMTIIQEEVKAGKKILEPDELSTIVNEAIAGNFLPPQSDLDIYFAAMSIVQQRILDLITTHTTDDIAFDNAEVLVQNLGKKRKRDNCSSSIKLYHIALREEEDQEVRDLIDDLRDMYEAADDYIKSTYNEESSFLREKIFRNRANVEAFLLLPMLSASSYLEEAIEYFEKIFRINQTAHPDSWQCYINFVMGSNFCEKTVNKNDNSLITGSTAAKFRFVRNLYHRAMTISKSNRNQLLCNEEYILSLKSLCTNFLAFESNYGSNNSKEHAKTLVRRKLTLINDAKPQESLKLPVDSNKITEQISKHKEYKRHTVMVGNLRYPAHPFTIHVSNLSPSTEDMDLYDLFDAKCGRIVHCRIFREKGGRQHGLPPSKCAGLVQFEERQSVEEAIKLNGEVGLHERLIKIERSSQPAVSIVPPGLHRVKPKGQGKSTKRNQKRKERRNKESGQSEDVNIVVADGSDASSPQQETVSSTTKKEDAPSKRSILSFTPRGVKQRKPKMTLK